MNNADYSIRITVTGRHVSYDFDPNMPFMLAEEIKRVVDDFYEED